MPKRQGRRYNLKRKFFLPEKGNRVKQRRHVSSGEDKYMKLAEIKTILAGNPTKEQLTELKKDERAGVQKLLAA